MTLTKEAIKRSVFDHLDHPKAASSKAVEAIFEVIKKAFENGEDVLISVFGKFCTKEKGKRIGRNPGPGEGLMLAERRVVTFKCGTVPKRKLNGGLGLFRGGGVENRGHGFYHVRIPSPRFELGFITSCYFVKLTDDLQLRRKPFPNSCHLSCDCPSLSVQVHVLKLFEKHIPAPEVCQKHDHDPHFMGDLCQDMVVT
jgi:integration host factor subunit alpha